MAHPRAGAGIWVPAAWRAAAGHVAAVLAAIPFLIAGVWKITDPHGAAVRLTQALVPGDLSLAAAVAFGIAELLGAVLIVVPSFRRWGAAIISALLIAFIVYIGINYTALSGEDCNCFPWIKRAVGPAFFVSDGLMLAFAFLAGLWAKRSSGLRSASVVLLAIVVFAGVSFGVGAVRAASLKAPAVVMVEGRPFGLRDGRVLLYFFDPECTHCLAAAQGLAAQEWNNVTVLAIPTERAVFARQFLQYSKLNARVVGPADTPAGARDIALLRERFPFTSVPYAVALVRGAVAAEFRYFDAKEPEGTLKQLGFIRDK